MPNLLKSPPKVLKWIWDKFGDEIVMDILREIRDHSKKESVVIIHDQAEREKEFAEYHDEVVGWIARRWPVVYQRIGDAQKTPRGDNWVTYRLVHLYISLKDEEHVRDGMFALLNGMSDDDFWMMIEGLNHNRIEQIVRYVLHRLRAIAEALDESVASTLVRHIERKQGSAFLHPEHHRVGWLVRPVERFRYVRSLKKRGTPGTPTGMPTDSTRGDPEDPRDPLSVLEKVVLELLRSEERMRVRDLRGLRERLESILESQERMHALEMQDRCEERETRERIRKKDREAELEALDKRHGHDWRVRRRELDDAAEENRRDHEARLEEIDSELRARQHKANVESKASVAWAKETSSARMEEARARRAEADARSVEAGAKSKSERTKIKAEAKTKRRKGLLDTIRELILDRRNRKNGRYKDDQDSGEGSSGEAQNKEPKNNQPDVEEPAKMRRIRRLIRLVGYRLLPKKFERRRHQDPPADVKYHVYGIGGHWTDSWLQKFWRRWS